MFNGVRQRLVRENIVLNHLPTCVRALMHVLGRRNARACVNIPTSMCMFPGVFKHH